MVDSVGLTRELEEDWMWGVKTRGFRGDHCVWGLSPRVGGSPNGLGTFSMLPAPMYCDFLPPLSAKLLLATDQCIYSCSVLGYVCFEWGKRNLSSFFWFRVLFSLQKSVPADGNDGLDSEQIS